MGIKKKVKEDPAIKEDVNALCSELAPTAPPEESLLNKAESSSKVSQEKMGKTLDLLSKEFNLNAKHFNLRGFNDKGDKSVAMAFSNNDFDLVITVNNQVKYGLIAGGEE